MAHSTPTPKTKQCSHLCQCSGGVVAMKTLAATAIAGAQAIKYNQHKLVVAKVTEMATMCGISPLLDSHKANIQQFLLKVHQTRFRGNSICSGNSHKISFARDLDSTLNLPGILPCVWCTTEWHHVNIKQKSRLIIWMTQSHAMSYFCPFSTRCLQDNAATSMPSASLFS